MRNTGKPFERIVAQIQAKLDPNSAVSHDEYIVDRLGQRRQFDVVIRGQFAGQAMLGVIECKDLNRKVGTPEVDAFHTKAQDINANFRVIASKLGFSEPAMQKARHYGIRLISLVDRELLNQEFAFGDWWVANVYRWKTLSIQAEPQGPGTGTIEAPPEDLLVEGKRVLDWFTNYLLKLGHNDKTLGWVVSFQLIFEPPINLSIKDNPSIPCKSISFFAERECREHERFVPLTAEAFLDWHTKSVSIPPNTTISTGAVTTDFHDWPLKNPAETRRSCFIPITLELHEQSFQHVEDAPDLESM